MRIIIGGMIAAGVIALFAFFASGCVSTERTRMFVDGADLMVKAWDPTVKRECIESLDAAVATAEAMPPSNAREEYASTKRAALYAKGCGEAVIAYDLLRTGVEDAYVTLDTIDAGECVNVSRSVDECNLSAVRRKVTKLLNEAIDAMAPIEKASK